MLYYLIALIISMAKYVTTPELLTRRKNLSCGPKSKNLPEGECTGDTSAMVDPLGY